MRKKQVLAVLFAAALAGSLLAGCGDVEEETSVSSSSGSSSAEEETDPEVYTTEELMSYSDYDITEYVTLGDYENIAVEVDSSYEVTDENIAASGEEIIADYPYYVETEEAAAEGDQVNIDYVGTIDGEEFDGGSAEEQDLVLGSGDYIDGFEDGLVGSSAGDTVTLDLTFPDDYSDEDLAGQDVTFEVTVNSVSAEQSVTYEGLTDEYVETELYDDYGVSTVDEFEEYLTESAESTLTVQIQIAYLDELVAASEATIPDGLIDERVDTAIEVMEESCESYGIDMEDYLEEYMDMTEDEYREAYAESLEESLPEELVLEALVNELQSEVEADEFDSFVTYYASYYGLDEDDFIEQCGGEEYLILNYAEYYVALAAGAETADVTYVESEDEDSEDEDTEEEEDSSDEDSEDEDSGDEESSEE